MPIMQQTGKKFDYFDYNDYLIRSNDQRREIIDGEAYDINPAPKVKHKKISRNLERIIFNNFTHPSKCGAFSAPANVVFDDYNIIQPDIFIICNKNKITEADINDAPDLIIEIVLPSTVLKDKRGKKAFYEKCDVSEYVLIYPELEYVERLYLENKKYNAADILNWDETLKLKAFDIEINLWEIFEKEPPKKEDNEWGKNEKENKNE
ncbi:MAG: Uma2 family endonuclease [Epsilonproteobacteria bacterium]|nr:Uma2 family endonuclease [Campylobacterota bacterium]